jgi:probable phosphoglycerate mutase
VTSEPSEDTSGPGEGTHTRGTPAVDAPAPAPAAAPAPAPAPADDRRAGTVGWARVETRLLLVRHGHARAVDDGVVAGHDGCTGLSAKGRRQAEALRDRLKASRLPVDAVVTSILPRAIETAEIVAEATNVDPASIPRDCALCERHPGEGDGLTWDELVARYGVEDPLEAPDRPLSPGGESPRAFRARVEASIAAVADDHRGQTVMVVAHGGVILSATLAFLGLSPRWFAHDLANTSLTEWVRTGDGNWLLHRFNDTAHLEGRPDLA